MKLTDLERLSKKFTINPTTNCWEWDYSTTYYGYANFWFNGRGRTAHKVLYEAIHGKVPSNLVLDHEKCDNRRCISPYHLVPKTDWENRRRSPWYGNATFCKRGHKRSTGNTYIRGSGKRECKGCRQLEMKRFYDKDRLKEVSKKNWKSSAKDTNRQGGPKIFPVDKDS